MADVTRKLSVAYDRLRLAEKGNRVKAALNQRKLIEKLESRKRVRTVWAGHGRLLRLLVWLPELLDVHKLRALVFVSILNGTCGSLRPVCRHAVRLCS